MIPCIFTIFLTFLIVAVEPAAAAEVFKLRSSAFSDNGLLEPKNAGDAKSNPNCTGNNVAPPFEWSEAPERTKSFAFLIYDPEGRNGLGVSHQVAYGIPASTTHFKEGDLNDPTKGFIGGKSTPGTTAYFGPCPPRGSGLHHYIFTIIATDLEPTALEPGLTREQLFEKLNGRAIGVAGIIGRFGQ